MHGKDSCPLIIMMDSFFLQGHVLMYRYTATLLSQVIKLQGHGTWLIPGGQLETSG